MVIKEYHIKSPTKVVTLQLGTPQEYMQECIKEAYRLGDFQNQQTNVKAIMSTWFIWNETKVFNLLLNKIKEIVYLSYPLNKSKWKYELLDAWSNIYQKNHYTLLHNHSPSEISFVYYLQSSGRTPLLFNESNFEVNPTDDTLVIFPSYLFHSVPKHQEEIDRICLAGNFLKVTK